MPAIQFHPDTERLRIDPCARAELYLARVAEIATGDPLYHDICTAALELESDCGVHDDWEGIDLAFRMHCTREDIPLPESRRARA